MFQILVKKSVALVAAALLFAGGNALAQAPQMFNYQAVARDAAGVPVVNQNIGVRATILDGAAGNATVYRETHLQAANNTGVFSLAIGQGTVVQGVFANINWATGNKWLQIEIDPAGGTNYTLSGSQQLLSVPYALFAGSTNNATNVQTYTSGPGINIVNNVVTNTGDINAADDVTLSTALSGDLSGTLPSPIVVQLQGRSVANVAPVSGEVLTWNGTQWVPSPLNLNLQAGTGIAIVGNVITNTGDTDAADDVLIGSALGGDLTGTMPNPLIGSIQGRPVAALTPAVGEVLKWNGVTWSPAPDQDNLIGYVAGPGILISGNVISNVGDNDPTDDITASTVVGGDLSGTLPNPNVVGLQNRPVSAAAPAVGQLLGWNGAAWVPTNDNIGTGDITDVIAGLGLIGGGTVGAVTVDANVQNGLSINNDFIELGGTLIKNTSVDIAGFNLTFPATTGRVGIGTTTPRYALSVYRNNDFAGVEAFAYTNNAGQNGVLVAGRARGSEAAPSGVIFGDNLGSVDFRGYTGSSFAANGAQIYARTTENWNNVQRGTDLYFATTQTGTGVTADRMVVSNSGNVGIGTIAPLGLLHVHQGTLLVTGVQSVTGNYFRRAAIGESYSYFAPFGEAGTAYLGFNTERGANGWRFDTDGTLNGGGLMDAALTGDLRFFARNSVGGAQQNLTDAQMLSELKMEIVGATGNVEVTQGDVYIETIGKGVIMRSPNGSCFRITVDNAGGFVSTPVACP